MKAGEYFGSEPFFCLHSPAIQVLLDPQTWHTFMLETVGTTLRASIDCKPVAYLQSPGIAHPTKSKVEFGCMGKDGFFDDLKIWNAEPVK